MCVCLQRLIRTLHPIYLFSFEQCLLMIMRPLIQLDSLAGEFQGPPCHPAPQAPANAINVSIYVSIYVGTHVEVRFL